MRQLKAIVVGAGLRGNVYADYALKYPNELKIVGVAEPDEKRRTYFKEKHNLDESMCFDSWNKILNTNKIADIAIISTMDKMHFEPTMEAIKLGYSILLEKPVSPIEEECVKITEYAKKQNVDVLVCHVLRYTPFYKTLKKLIGRVGKIISVTHCENVGNIHQSHSFVRGNWRNSDESSPMILQKCCHDMDILQWLIESKPKTIVSFGGISYFNKENAPKNAPDYCLDGCPNSDSCPYFAPKVYLAKGQEWMRSAVAMTANTEELLEILKTSPYGRCVFKCDNDVVDHQVANIVFENDVTVAFTMCAFTKQTDRTMKIMGSDGEIRAIMGEKDIIEIRDFETNTIESHYVNNDNSGHGGGDEGIMRDVVRYVNGMKVSTSITDINSSIKSHLMSFYAEKSRVTGEIIHWE